MAIAPAPMQPTISPQTKALGLGGNTVAYSRHGIARMNFEGRSHCPMRSAGSAIATHMSAMANMQTANHQVSERCGANTQRLSVAIAPTSSSTAPYE